MLQHSRNTLREFLSHNRADVASMSVLEFRSWLQNHIDRAARGELFRARCRARDLYRTHRRRLSDRDRRLELARQAWAANPFSEQLSALESQLQGYSRAVDGLTAAVEAGEADPQKLSLFRGRLREAESQRQRLLSDTDSKRLQRAEASRQRLQDEIGLTAAKQQVEQLASQQGSAAVRSGTAYEQVSASAVRKLLLPRYRGEYREVLIINGATLGCPRGEFDHLVIGLDDPNGIAHVLALVEAKRNINDIPHGFRLRQENLAWFVGDQAGFDEQAYRTSHFPTGHFDRPYVHDERGRKFRFDPASFVRFEKSETHGCRIDRLCFVTEQRRLQGVESSTLTKLIHFVSSDRSFTLEEDYQLPGSDLPVRRLRKRLLAEVQQPQAAGVLEMFATSDQLAGQIIFADRDASPQ